MRHTAYKTMTAFAVAIVAMMIGATFQASAQGNIGGRVTNPDPKNTRSSSIFIYKLKHGQAKTDQLTVMNSTDTKQTINIGSVDGVMTNTGAFTCRQEAEPVRDSGGWVDLSTNKVTLAPGAHKNISFTVKVPQKADVGEHNSCITMQSADDDVKNDGSGLRIHMRQAVRMSVTIPGDLKRELTIENFEASSTGNSPKYDITVANKGNVSADVDMRVDLYSLFGQQVDRVGGEYPVFPNESLAQNLSSTFRPLFGGVYTAKPSIAFDKRLGVYGTQSGADSKLETVTGDGVKIMLLPTAAGWLIIIGVISALVAGVWLSVNRLRHNASIKSRLGKYTVKSGDTLQSLADQRDIRWRDIARINKIPAPYTLEPGSTILLPAKNKDKK